MLSLDVFENAIVGGRGAAHVVLGLQAIDRHTHLQAAACPPSCGNRPHGARHDLHVHAHRGQRRQQHVEFAESHERLAADDRHVQRLLPLDDVEHAVDELLSLVIGKFPQYDVAAQVLVAVRVTPRAAQRALASDFDRQIRTVARENQPPGFDNGGAFHA